MRLATVIYLLFAVYATYTQYCAAGIANALRNLFQFLFLFLFLLLLLLFQYKLILIKIQTVSCPLPSPHQLVLDLSPLLSAPFWWLGLLD